LFEIDVVGGAAGDVFDLLLLVLLDDLEVVVFDFVLDPVLEPVLELLPDPPDDFKELIK